MSSDSFDNAVAEAVQTHRKKLAEHLGATVVFYSGPLVPAILSFFRDFIEEEKKNATKQQRRRGAANPNSDRLAVVLNTLGGTAESVEKMVEIMRHHFQEVYFVVPQHAMSAGTILCMSGNKIYMDYASSLGPIDPQVYNKEGKLVPATGYLDQVEILVNKSRQNLITPAELLMLQNLDLAMLDFYRKARDITVTLLKKWLVNYKFQTWTEHRTDPNKLGQPVTLAEKEDRAEEIARLLSNNSHWQSHGRFIGIGTLRTELKLEIEDYSGLDDVREMIRGYHDLLVEYMRTRNINHVLHGATRHTI